MGEILLRILEHLNQGPQVQSILCLGERAILCKILREMEAEVARESVTLALAALVSWQVD